MAMNVKLVLIGTGVLAMLGCGADEFTSTPHQTAPIDVAIGKMVSTPFGMRDGSCVHKIPTGSVVDSAGNVTLNGQTIASYQECEGTATASSATVSPDSGFIITWDEGSTANATTLYGLTMFNLVGANWTVPALPSVNAGQVIYFQMGLGNSTESILPTLQWGDGDEFTCTTSWCVSNWYVNTAGQVYVTTPFNVAVGDHLAGNVTIASGSPLQYASQIWDETTNTYSQATYTVGAAPNVAVGGFLQTKNVSACSQLPAPVGGSSLTLFEPVELYQAGPAWYDINAVSPTFSNLVGSPQPASCGFKAVSKSKTPAEVDLFY